MHTRELFNYAIRPESTLLSHKPTFRISYYKIRKFIFFVQHPTEYLFKPFRSEKKKLFCYSVKFSLGKLNICKVNSLTSALDSPVCDFTKVVNMI